MTGPEKVDPLKALQSFAKDIAAFNQLTLEEKKQKIKQIANALLEKEDAIKSEIFSNKDLNRDKTIIEVTVDFATITECALNPLNVFGCLSAIADIIDLVQKARQAKPSN